MGLFYKTGGRRRLCKYARTKALIYNHQSGFSSSLSHIPSVISTLNYLNFLHIFISQMTCLQVRKGKRGAEDRTTRKIQAKTNKFRISKPLQTPPPPPPAHSEPRPLKNSRIRFHTSPPTYLSIPPTTAF